MQNGGSYRVTVILLSSTYEDDFIVENTLWYFSGESSKNIAKQGNAILHINPINTKIFFIPSPYFSHITNLILMFHRYNQLNFSVPSISNIFQVLSGNLFNFNRRGIEV